LIYYFNKTILRQDEKLKKSYKQYYLCVFISLIISALDKINSLIKYGNKARDGDKSCRAELKKKLNKAGINVSAAEYFLIKLSIITGMIIINIKIFMYFGLYHVFMFLAVLVGTYIGYSVPHFYLSKRIKRRRIAILEQLPDMLDFFCLSFEAGLSFEQVIRQIINHFDGALIDELKIVYNEMSMGIKRCDALLFLCERCDIDELKVSVNELIQARKFGASLNCVLRTQANTIRKAKKSKIEEKSIEVSLKMRIPIFIITVLVALSCYLDLRYWL
jgi:tight adherence protein C